eukprot:m.112533 g.112533  ORF g.112533 m.112533 type:complete len:770 (-) comp16188_c0_seq1:98-2407(-)
MAAAMSDIVHAGWANKRGNNVRNWKRRYFVLRTDGTLSYYVDSLASMTKPKGVIKCNRHTQILGPQSSACRNMQWPPETNAQATFAIDIQGRTYFLFCGTEDDATQWRQLIDQTLRSPAGARHPSTAAQARRPSSLANEEDSSDEDEPTRRQTHLETETVVKQLLARNTSLLKRVEGLEADLAKSQAANAALRRELGELQSVVHRFGSVNAPDIRVASDSEPSCEDDDFEDELPGDSSGTLNLSSSHSAARHYNSSAMRVVDAVIIIQRWWRMLKMQSQFLQVKDGAIKRGRKRTMDKIEQGTPTIALNPDQRTQQFLLRQRRPTTSLDTSGHRMSMPPVLEEHGTILEEEVVPRSTSMPQGPGALTSLSQGLSQGPTQGSSTSPTPTTPSSSRSSGVAVDRYDRRGTTDSLKKTSIWATDDIHDARCRPARMAMFLFNKKPIKGLRRFVADNLLPKDPAAVATFLSEEPGLARSMVGEFIGDVDPFCVSVLQTYAHTFDFSESPLDLSLRLFLLSFRIPGEAQKIERVLTKFAQRYHECNPGLFQHEDTALVLAFSVMMLHTDLHNRSNPRKMTKAEFVRNNRGIDDGQNIPAPYLEGIYSRIATEEFQCTPDHTRKVQELATCISGKFVEPLVQTWRVFVARSAVTELFKSKEPAPKRTCTLILFNDVLLVCKGRGRHLALRDRLELAKFYVRDAELTEPLPGTIELMDAEDRRRMLYRFQFIHNDAFIALLREYVEQMTAWEAYKAEAVDATVAVLEENAPESSSA